MNRLIAAGLMFGNLVPVTSAALVERYNRALKHLTGHETKLPDFHIDIAGFSPEIGAELGDPAYLNPSGANRQFILLTLKQKDAPLLNMRFSTAWGILRQFYDKNEAQLFALTARDAVAGEVTNSVYDLKTPAQLMDLRQFTVEADTIGGHVRDAAKLAALIARFRREPDGWRDDVLIAEMIGLAKQTGDIGRVPIDLPAMTFRQDNFWTSLFGGIYVFREARFPAVITARPVQSFPDFPAPMAIDLTMRNAIADWLDRNGLVEPIVQARGMDAAAVLRQKMDFILVDAADRLDLDIRGGDRTELRKIAHRLGSALPEEFLGLAALLRWVERAGDWPRITSEHPSYFYTLRAKQGPDRDLVNMLLAELSPLDVRQMFILHKELFYAQYATWTDRKQAYVVEFLTREYQVDRTGARAALFGPEPGMDDRPRAPVDGPWGRRA
jgi:hypothetical protein